MFKIIFFPFFKVLIMSFYSNTFIFYAIIIYIGFLRIYELHCCIFLLLYNP